MRVGFGNALAASQRKRPNIHAGTWACCAGCPPRECTPLACPALAKASVRGPAPRHAVRAEVPLLCCAVQFHDSNIKFPLTRKVVR